MTIPFNIDSNFLNTHTESMLGDLSMNGAFARSDPSPALRDQTYVTVEDNTAVLPNSMPLSGLSSGFLSNTTLTGILNPRTFMGTANQITVADGDGVGGNPTLSLPSDLRLPGTMRAGGNINMNGYNLVSTAGQNIKIVPGGGLDWIELLAYAVNIQEQIIFNSTPINNITFTSGSQSLFFNLNNTNAMRLSSSGLKLNSGATINNIDDTGTSYSSNAAMTAMGVQLAISTALDAGVSFRGGWDPVGGLFPSTGGTGTAGAIEKGNWWYITVLGTLNGQPVEPGDWITAVVDTPGQTGSNWLISFQGVTSVFGRIGPVVAADNDYPFAYITGLPDTATLGKLMRGNGTAWVETTAAYPNSAGTAGTILRSDGTDIVNSTPKFPNTATEGRLMRGNGTDWTESALTYPNSISANQLLYGSAGFSNTISTLTTPNSSYLASDASGNLNWTARSYARIYTGISAGAGNSLTFGSTPTEITGTPVAFTLDSASSSDFTMAIDGRLKYTGEDTKTFMCYASFSCTNAAGGQLQIYKNGSPTTNGIARGLLSGVSGPTGTLVTLAYNDYLSLFVNFFSGSAAPSIYTAQLAVESVKDS